VIILKIDGRLTSVGSGREAIAACFGSMESLKYWSYAALREMYRGVLEILSDYHVEDYGMMSGSEKAAVTRFRSYCANKIKYTPRDRNKLLEFIYEVILECEKMRRLHGFGFGNQGGNAEAVRMSKDRNIK